MSAASASRTAFYQRVAAVDVRTLPLLPEQAFVLSRVDGKSDATAIARETGIPAPEVTLHLSRLEELGAISIDPAPQGPSPTRGRTPAPEPVATARPSAPPRLPSAPVSGNDPSNDELDESLSISLDLQRRILDLSARLAELDHFELLGIRRDADRAAVKRAYFSMIGTFHPDRYFGKKLGSYTRRMEKIFQRLTEAHDVLSNRQAREEYEAYLSALQRTRSLEAPSEPPPSVEDLEKLLLQAEQQAQRPPVASTITPAAAGAAPPPPASASPPPAQPPPLPLLRPGHPPPLPQRSRPPSLRPVVSVVDDPAARRQALARKLGLTAPAPAAPEPPNEERIRADAQRRSAAARELRDRYQHRKAAIRDQRVHRFTRAAEEAVAAGNAVSALNTIKIARSLSAGDVAVAERLDELEKQVGATVADSYLQRARYEESNGHYEEAARSYTRAARGMPDPDVLRSAAECYMKAGVELRLAGELAREAVQLAPNRSDLRLTLAKIYEAAGMPQSAVRELERALEITPDSDRIKQWLKRLQRGGV